MKSKRPPALIEHYGAAMARAIGTRRLAVMLGMFGFYVAVNLFSNFTDELLKHWGPFARAFPLLAVATVFWLWVRGARDSVTLGVTQTRDVQPCNTLILFLSPPRQDEVNLPSLLADESIRGRISDPSIRERFAGPWRMPIEAVAAHLSRLKRVVILGSSDSRGVPGTYRQVVPFRELLKRLLPEPTRVALLDITMQEFGDKWSAGVDFEDLGALVEALQTVLRQSGGKPYEAIIDLTGGQKVTSVAGAAVSLGIGRRFQYVSTLDRVPTVYDLTYESSD